MTDNQTMADRLYGGSEEQSPSPASAPPPAPALVDRSCAPPPAPASRDDVPDAVKALREADTARRMFSPAKAFAADLPDGSLPGVDIAEAREVAADLGVEPADLREFRALANDTTEPDVEAWRVQSHEMLAERGYTTADLDAARQLARRDPRVLDYLDATGLGDHPKVVERFIHLARRARIAGTLPHLTVNTKGA
jgi:hypothetical protein